MGSLGWGHLFWAFLRFVSLVYSCRFMQENQNRSHFCFQRKLMVAVLLVWWLTVQSNSNWCIEIISRIQIHLTSLSLVGCFLYSTLELVFYLSITSTSTVFFSYLPCNAQVKLKSSCLLKIWHIGQNGLSYFQVLVLAVCIGIVETEKCNFLYRSFLFFPL